MAPLRNPVHRRLILLGASAQCCSLTSRQSLMSNKAANRTTERGRPNRRKSHSEAPSPRTVAQIFLICPACFPRPLRSSSRMKLTLSPSFNTRMPAASRALAWTNTSLPPSSGSIKPNPFAHCAIHGRPISASVRTSSRTPPRQVWSTASQVFTNATAFVELGYHSTAHC